MIKTIEDQSRTTYFGYFKIAQAIVKRRDVAPVIAGKTQNFTDNIVKITRGIPVGAVEFVHHVFVAFKPLNILVKNRKPPIKADSPILE